MAFATTPQTQFPVGPLSYDPGRQQAQVQRAPAPQPDPQRERALELAIQATITSGGTRDTVRVAAEFLAFLKGEQKEPG